MRLHSGRKAQPQDGKRGGTILLQGAYGNGNSGDDAILVSVLSELGREIPRAFFKVISLDPQTTCHLVGDNVQVLSAPWRSWSGFRRNLSLLRWASLYVFGGGGLISEQRQPVMVGLLLRLVVAKLLRTRTMIYAVGCNPLSSTRARLLARLTMSLADRVTVRDAFSLRSLTTAGVPRERVTLTADAASVLVAAPPRDGLSLLHAEGVEPSGGPLLGVAVAHSLKDPAIDVLAQAIDRLVAVGKRVVLLPFERVNDLPAAMVLYNRLDRRHGVHVLRAKLTPAQLKAVVGRLDVMLSMRLHPLVFAVDEAVPVIALTCVPKAAQFMRRIGQQDRVLYLDWMAEAGYEPALDLERLLACVQDAMSTSDDIRRALLQAREELRALSHLNAQIAASLVR